MNYHSLPGNEVTALQALMDQRIAANEAQTVAWLNQPDWWVDPILGNDNNDGSAANPLATLNEYTRRIGSGVVPVLQTVNIVGDIDYSAEAVVFRGSYDIAVFIVGERTVERSGTITGVQTWDAATDQDGQITDAGVANWTADENRLIVLTSGPNAGAAGWVASDLGGGDTCRFSAFFEIGAFDTIDPAIAETYDVVTLSTATGIMRLENGGAVVLQDLHLVELGFLGALQVASGSGQIRYAHIEDVFGSVMGAGVPRFWSIVGSLLDASDFEFRAGETFLNAALITKRLLIQQGGRVVLPDDTMAQATASAEVADGGILHVLAAGALAVFDMPGASDNCLNVQCGGEAQVQGRGWGTGNNGATATGLRVDSGAMVYYAGTGADRFGFAGATLDEINLAADDTPTYAGLGAVGTNGVNAVRLAGIVPATFV
jgi:hypothetical protein